MASPPVSLVQLNVRIPADLLHWLDGHANTFANRRGCDRGHRSMLIELLIRAEMAREQAEA